MRVNAAAKVPGRWLRYTSNLLLQLLRLLLVNGPGFAWTLELTDILFVSPGLGFMPAVLHNHLRSDLTIISGGQERLNAPLCPLLSRSLCLPPTEFPFSGSQPASLRPILISQIVWCEVSLLEKTKNKTCTTFLLSCKKKVCVSSKSTALSNSG